MMQGTIIYYNPRKYIGFIETETHEEYFFHYVSNWKEGRTHKVRQGDLVEFTVQPSEKIEGKTVAVITEFRGNNRWDSFVEDIHVNAVRGGYLKKTGESWSFKVMPEKFMVPVKGPSRYETNVSEVYDERENAWVNAVLSVNKKSEVTATLTDRVFQPEFDQVRVAKEEAAPIQARITGQNDDVYFVDMYSGRLTGVIRKAKLPTMHSYKKGITLSVIPVMVSETMIGVLPEEVKP